MRFKRLLIVAGIVLAGVFGVLLTSERQPENALVVGTGPIYPPYTSLNAAGELVGIDMDVAKSIADSLGKELVVKRMEFDGLILALKQGKIDLIVSGMTITPSRLEEIAMLPYMGEPMDHFELAFWEKIPDGVQQIEDLAGQKVAVESGTIHHDFLKTVKGIQIKTLEGVPEVTLDVQYGKAAAALMEPHTAAEVKAKLPQVKLLTVPLLPEKQTLGMGIGINKQRTELIAQVQAALDQMHGGSP